jgi:uncharacterized protein (TIGR03083 family)
LDAAVPSCPDWTTGDLLSHITTVHRWVEAVVRTGEFASPAELVPAAPDVNVFEEATAALVERLSSVAPGAPVWNWSANQPKVAAFWPRRMALETAVHRSDGQGALGAGAGAGGGAGAGAVSPVDAALAVDGVDEFLDVFLGTRPPAGSSGGSLHLHATDVPGEWLVSFEGGVVDVQRGHAKGDAALRGTASDLFLFLWGRAGPDALEVFGDPAVVEAWRQVKF